MTQPERLRLTFEYLTVLEFYKQWYDLEWSASKFIDRQISSFNKFFKKHCEEIKTRFKDVTLTPQEQQSLHSWDNVCKYIYD